MLKYTFTFSVGITIATMIQAMTGASEDNIRMFADVTVLSWIAVCMVLDLKDDK